jgi:zinc transport system substrate-binding protein
VSHKLTVVIIAVAAGLVLGFTAFYPKKVLTLPSTKLPVTVSFYPLAEFVQQVGQDKVIVYNLTRAGTEPHDFDPSPQDLVKIENSKVLVYNGAGLEIWVDKLRDQFQNKLKMVNSTENISLLQSEAENRPDPHVWLDPVLASQQVENITQALAVADPEHKSYYEQNAKSYQQQLSDLDIEFKKGLEKCQSREVVTSHNAFQYLGKRYGLTILSISGLSPDEEPTPQKLAEVVQFVKVHNVKYIFFESLVSPKLAETIATEAGAKTLSFNPLEGLTSEELSKGKNYLTVQRENLAALRTALGCE